MTRNILFLIICLAPAAILGQDKQFCLDTTYEINAFKKQGYISILSEWLLDYNKDEIYFLVKHKKKYFLNSTNINTGKNSTIKVCIENISKDLKRKVRNNAIRKICIKKPYLVIFYDNNFGLIFKLKNNKITMQMGLKCIMQTIVGQEPKNNFKKENIVLKPVASMPDKITASIAAVSTYKSASKVITKNFKGEEILRQTIINNTPFYGNDDDLKGIYIFNVETIEEAEALTNSDPAIKAGSLRMELKKWYGSAALLEVNQIHKTLTKKSIAE